LGIGDYEVLEMESKKSDTNRLRVWNLVSKEHIHQNGENLDLRIVEVNPLFDKGLLFDGSTQQHGGIWITARDNW
jgi:hypothetical protein